VVVDGLYGHGQGCSIGRQELDAALVRAAVASGAQLEEEVLVDAPSLTLPDESVACARSAAVRRRSSRAAGDCR
jgi:hypothetical protein